jgi:hypothetical protein
MTRRQRAQVVELLRCAADRCDPFDTALGFASTAYAVGTSHEVRYLTCDALVETVGDRGNDWQAACLEAALRVEQGEWP